jgi:UDPglucose--hexose-1-phosphate uridylyltransferase
MPELRRDPIVASRWVVFSPERRQRPQELPLPSRPLPGGSPFTQGNERLTPPEVFAIRAPGSPPNSPGWKVRVVPNRFPALRIEGELGREPVGFYDRMNGIGAHEVIIETPDPSLDLEDQSQEGVADVLKAFRARMADLKQDVRLRYVLIFKNVGSLAGATLRHPHSQLIALPVIPRSVQEKLHYAKLHWEAKERSIFEDVLRSEQKSGERMVAENSGFAAFCPYASRFPFEVCIMPKFHAPDFYTLDEHNLALLAEILRTILRKLRRGLKQLHYNFLIHTAPFRDPRSLALSFVDEAFRWHIEILPRLANVAGFEYGSGFYINTVLPEEAAEFLRRMRVD